MFSGCPLSERLCSIKAGEILDFRTAFYSQNKKLLEEGLPLFHTVDPWLVLKCFFTGDSALLSVSQHRGPHTAPSVWQRQTGSRSWSETRDRRWSCFFLRGSAELRYSPLCKNPLGTGETSNYSNTPLGTAVCRSSPHLFWNRERRDSTLQKGSKAQCEISSLICVTVLTFPSSRNGFFVFVTLFEHVYFLI